MTREALEKPWSYCEQGSCWRQAGLSLGRELRIMERVALQTCLLKDAWTCPADEIPEAGVSLDFMPLRVPLDCVVTKNLTCVELHKDYVPKEPMLMLTLKGSWGGAWGKMLEGKG